MKKYWEGDKAGTGMEREVFVYEKLSPFTQATTRPEKAVGIVKSVTKNEIDRYWRLKKIDEDEHLLAALKAAARIRAKALSEEDYKRFEESLRDDIKGSDQGMDGDDNKELRVGIKDWWTKSKYAYLNQPPATRSMGDDAASKKANPIYAAHKNCSFSPPPSSYSSMVTSLGVF